MAQSTIRRRHGVAMFLTTAATAALCMGTAAPATAAASSPIGTWAATAVAGSSPPAHTTFIFGEAHTVLLLGPAAADGTPQYVGAGRWKSAAAGTFDFDITHPLPDQTGKIIGFIHGTQHATLSERTFSSSGTSYLYGLDGHVQGPVPVTITATRTQN